MKKENSKKIMGLPNVVYFRGKEIILKKECPKGKIYFIKEKFFTYNKKRAKLKGIGE